MLNFSRFKIFTLLAICFLAFWFSLPTFLGDKANKFSILPNSKVNLGLDLSGGSYLLLEVDVNLYEKEQLDNLRSDIRDIFRGEKIANKRINYSGTIDIIANKVTFTLLDDSISDGVVKLIKSMSNDLIIERDDKTIFVSYSDAALKKMQKSVMDQSVEIVRRRVDEMGTREPDIQLQGENRILLQVPGLSDPEYLKELLGKTAKLTFHLLDDAFLLTDSSNRQLPPDTGRYKSMDGTKTYAIKKRVLISGDSLINAAPGVDQYGRAVVNIRFDNIGTKKFADITKANVGKPFAIILDGKVVTAPNIKQAILGGSAEISGDFTMQEANDIAILLRAGALPAPLDVVEERTVGPSLGADSIKSGKVSAILGLILVIGFMIASYRLFGLFSGVALIINMMIIIAVIALFGATLTLPGIAGIVLTMGMAVDGNVLIFERIKEEIKLGMSPYSAVENGFKQAFRTILDSNITTLIAALLLYIFGSGPIKGFAVTLSVGILSSMFSSILITRMMVVSWLKAYKPSKIVL